MESSVNAVVQENPYLPEQERVGKQDGTQPRAINPVPSVTVGVNLLRSQLRRQSRKR